MGANMQARLSQAVVTPLCAQILRSPSLTPEKMDHLMINTTSEFTEVKEDTSVKSIRRELLCSMNQAQKYKAKYLEINWADNSAQTAAKIEELLVIVSEIMDWRVNPANAESIKSIKQNDAGARFFQPAPIQLQYMALRQQGTPEQIKAGLEQKAAERANPAQYNPCPIL